MKKIMLMGVILAVSACSKADGTDGLYYRSNATPFEARHGMAKGLLIEDSGRKVVLQHNWGNDVLNVKRQDGRLLVTDGGEPVYYIDIKNGTAVISSVETDFPTNRYEFRKERKK